MEFIMSIFRAISDLGSTLMLPVMFTVIGLIFGCKFSKALKAGQSRLGYDEISFRRRIMLIVKKFGGTSVANKERIFNVARRCIEDYKKGNDVVVVLSAMGKYTDELISMAVNVNEKPPKREMDMCRCRHRRVSSVFRGNGVRQWHRFLPCEIRSRCQSARR